MIYVLKNKETGEVIDPRVDEFALSPADLGDFDNWDDALGQHSEVDLVEGYEVVGRTKTLDYLICPMDLDHFAPDDEEAKMDESVARRVAESHGWDASDSKIVHMDPALVDNWINSNRARKCVGVADEYNGPPEWITCFHVSWEDYMEHL